MWRFLLGSALTVSGIGLVALLYDVFSLPFTCGLCVGGPLLLLFSFGAVERYAVSRYGDETVFDKNSRELRRNGDVVARFEDVEGIEIGVDERRYSPYLNVIPLRLYLRIRDSGGIQRYRLLDETDREVVDALAQRLSAILDVETQLSGRLVPRGDQPPR